MVVFIYMPGPQQIYLLEISVIVGSMPLSNVYERLIIEDPLLFIPDTDTDDDNEEEEEEEAITVVSSRERKRGNRTERLSLIIWMKWDGVHYIV